MIQAGCLAIGFFIAYTVNYEHADGLHDKDRW